jgi:hypothetical protein
VGYIRGQPAEHAPAARPEASRQPVLDVQPKLGQVGFSQRSADGRQIRRRRRLTDQAGVPAEQLGQRFILSTGGGRAGSGRAPVVPGVYVTFGQPARYSSCTYFLNVRGEAGFTPG